ncbi:MAG: hypothetical protein A2W23_08075 [Planctomycetes bacterium RBG_16_43_13]|nr:MAG: hypothetical protein A2W23_08075 [Planctomycetes bacterium RBG_16_43_13]
MKKVAPIVVIFLFIISSVKLVHAEAAITNAGINSCGYEMMIVPLISGQASADAVQQQPAVTDAWTTNDPYANPESEVYEFLNNQDTLAFVVKYSHAGGLIPEQWARGWQCGNEEKIVKTCNFKWTVGYLPSGDYLLINYFDPVQFKAGEYEWASKVGNVVFGWPNISSTRPWCMTIH